MDNIARLKTLKLHCEQEITRLKHTDLPYAPEAIAVREKMVKEINVFIAAYERLEQRLYPSRTSTNNFSMKELEAAIH